MGICKSTSENLILLLNIFPSLPPFFPSFLLFFYSSFMQPLLSPCCYWDIPQDTEETKSLPSVSSHYRKGLHKPEVHEGAPGAPWVSEENGGKASPIGLWEQWWSPRTSYKSRCDNNVPGACWIEVIPWKRNSISQHSGFSIAIYTLMIQCLSGW